MHTPNCKNIAEIVKTGRCLGCGTCVSVCAQNAIDMFLDIKKGLFLPKINISKCTTCGKCTKTCPGLGLDFDYFNKLVFGHVPSNVFLGNVLKSYFGCSTDYDLRFNSASGGLISQLLLSALEDGIISGALVTRMNKKNPLLPETIIARSREDILSAAKSKYSPIPVNIALKKIAQESGQFAIVGLPCHIQAVRMVQRQLPIFQNKIKLCFGLFCGRTQSVNMTKTLLWRLGINPKDVNSLTYRGEGWPGKIVINLCSGKKITVDFLKYYNALGGGWFCPPRCMLCPDATSELADISFGDAWKFGKGDKIGSSLIMVRTQAGVDLVNKAVLKKQVQIIEVPPNSVVDSAVAMLKSKKKQLIPCQMMARVFRQEIPYYNVILPKNSLSDYSLAFLRYSSFYSPLKDYTQLLALYAPLPLLGLYQKAIAGAFRL